MIRNVRNIKFILHCNEGCSWEKLGENKLT